MQLSTLDPVHVNVAVEDLPRLVYLGLAFGVPESLRIRIAFAFGRYLLLEEGPYDLVLRLYFVQDSGIYDVAAPRVELPGLLQVPFKILLAHLERLEELFLALQEIASFAGLNVEQIYLHLFGVLGEVPRLLRVLQVVRGDFVRLGCNETG